MPTPIDQARAKTIAETARRARKSLAAMSDEELGRLARQKLESLSDDELAKLALEARSDDLWGNVLRLFLKF